MIKTKKELKFYMMADRIMNGCRPCQDIKTLISNILTGGGKTVLFLKYMRKVDYFSHRENLFDRVRFYYFTRRYNKISTQLGYDICPDSFGYGLVLPHRGTKVVGGGNRIGNYAVLHTSTCITAGSKVIGDGLYLSAGAKIIKDIRLGDNVTVSVNSVVNKDFKDSNLLLTGMPAVVKTSEYETWYDRDGFRDRVDKVEQIRKQMDIG